MIDACMRALHRHGWINFRMRAMLISFASYQLWLHWKRLTEYLARQFIDFEPGIHYSQIQMQSGVTGVNTICIYSPEKQLIEQDPEGSFVRKHVPELQALSMNDLIDPGAMPPLLQMSSGFKLWETYPHPIVDPKLSYVQAGGRIFAWKKQIGVREASQQTLTKRGSRAGVHFPKQKRS